MSAHVPRPPSLVAVCGRAVRAVIFDLDGVITDTAVLHRRAWTAVFDEFLARYDPTQQHFTEQDYLTYVDGKTRTDGTRSFLSARSISLDESSTSDDRDTVAGLAERKDRMFRDLLAAEGPHPIAPSVGLIRRLRHGRIPVAVVSASRHAAEVLSAAGLADAVDVRVDGLEAARLRLPGKPDPALFLEAARRLGVAPTDAAVVEDAESGVQAARHGGFGLVVGIAPPLRATALVRSGADVVVPGVDALDWETCPNRE
ncbi:beta-phosphoglucomutase family hydrolase [Rhodococcus sp. NPDC003318]|uniref:beta-phosphoglucomutase family hydrolase n=1 Tax=Rhodococcus sp. NPDC003318 TaxID=3364503 RepID=UPI00367482CC